MPPINEPRSSSSTLVRGILWTLLLAVIWPAAAAVSLSVAVGETGVSRIGLILVACGTISAYGLDRWIDGRNRDSRQLRRVLLVIVVIASLATGVLACTAWWRLQVCAGLGVLAAAYVPLKQVIPKNVLTTTAWTAATATLPFDGLPNLNPTFGASVLAVAFIMAANTVLCDLPDFAADRQVGVRGITPRFGPRVGGFAAFVCAVLGTIVAGSVGHWGLALTAFGLAVLAILWALQPNRGLFRLLADGLVTVVPGPLAVIFR